MRVLMLSWEYPPHIVGGMGKHVTDLIPALANEGAEVFVVTPLLRGGASEEDLPSGGRVVRVAVPPMEDYEFSSFVMQANHEIEQAAQILRQQVGHFDLIHAHDWLASSAAASLKHAWRIPLVATIHATERGRGRGQLGSQYAQRINNFEWWLTYEAWRVIICSQFMAQQIVDYFHAPADKIDVVSNGVHLPPDPFGSSDERLAFRRRFANDDQQIAYYVGRVVYEKGLGVLIAAWPQVLARRQARLVIAGAGGYLDVLKQQVRDLGLGEHVLFTGFISDADRDRLYHVADVATFPSLYEPFGIVALEAMAACCPVVVAATGGLAEVVRPHQTGITVTPDDPGALAWGILHTLQHPDWAKLRAKHALKEAQDVYNWQRIARETVAVYTRVYDEWQNTSWGKELTTT